MKYKFVDSKFLAKCANIIDKSINLSLIGLLIIPILSVACNDVNSTAYAQLLSNNLSTKAASSQSPAGQIRILLENAVLEISNNDTSKALANINLVDRQLVALGNSPAIQSLNVIVKDSAGLLQVGSTDKALVRLDQASQRACYTGNKQ